MAWNMAALPRFGLVFFPFFLPPQIMFPPDTNENTHTGVSVASSQKEDRFAVTSIFFCLRMKELKQH